MGDDPVALATYALVLATILLVIASAVRAIMDVVRARRDRAVAASKVVPDLNLLHSRLRVQARHMAAHTSMGLPLLDETISEMETNMRMVANIADNAHEVSLKFANETFLVRHFITRASDDLRLLARKVAEETGGVSIHDNEHHGGHSHASRPGLSVEARLAKVTASLIAASDSLNAGESLLPKKVRTVDGHNFWDRYRATADEREDAAEKKVLDLRKALPRQIARS